MEQALELLTTELANTRLQLQVAQEEVVHLRKEPSAQQEKLLEVHKLLEAKKAEVKKLSIENEALQLQLSY